MDPIRELDVLIRAKYPIVYVVTWEEMRFEEAVREIAEKLNRKVHTWSVTQGMKPAVIRTSGPRDQRPWNNQPLTA